MLNLTAIRKTSRKDLEEFIKRKFDSYEAIRIDELEDQFDILQKRLVRVLIDNFFANKNFFEEKYIHAVIANGTKEAILSTISFAQRKIHSTGLSNKDLDKIRKVICFACLKPSDYLQLSQWDEIPEERLGVLGDFYKMGWDEGVRRKINQAKTGEGAILELVKTLIRGIADVDAREADILIGELYGVVRFIKKQLSEKKNLFKFIELSQKKPNV